MRGPSGPLIWLIHTIKLPELMALEMVSVENAETKNNVALVNDQRDTAKVVTFSDDVQCAISRSTKP